ncbi:MAG: hypothetical protein JSS02_08380 [Planctomycetes bacterium]|nr:hypothetical protein [Planctomycetota bacterium]
MMTAEFVREMCDKFRTGFVKICVTIGSVLIAFTISALLLPMALGVLLLAWAQRATQRHEEPANVIVVPATVV